MMQVGGVPESLTVGEGGQRQRVAFALALALCGDPDALILTEPIGSTSPVAPLPPGSAVPPKK